MKKEKIEEIKQFVEQECKDWHELKLLDIENKNKKTHLTLVDSNNYNYYLEIGVLKRSKNRGLKPNIFFRNNLFTRDNIINYLKLNNKSFTLVSKELDNAKNKLMWNCEKHGNFEMSWNCVKNGQGCRECGIEKVADIRRNSYEYVKEQFEKKGLILISETYTNNEEKLKYICTKHEGKGIQEIKYTTLISAKGCYYCGRESVVQSNQKTHEQFELEINLIHGDKYTIIEDYTDCNKKINIYCNECEKIFPIRPSHFLSGHGCPTCSSSRGEKSVQQFLDLNCIPNIPQKRFNSCKNKKVLPFDFYLPDHNMVIEYHGIQHYKPVEIFGGEEQFKIQKINDKIKKDYCIKNNIIYLEIPYKKYKKINEILSNILLREA